MVKGLLKVKPHFEEQLTEEQWKFAGVVAAGLKPFEELTIRVQKEQYVFGDLLRDAMICEIALEDMSPTSEFCAALLSSLGKRKEAILAPDNLPL